MKDFNYLDIFEHENEITASLIDGNIEYASRLIDDYLVRVKKDSLERTNYTYQLDRVFLEVDPKKEVLDLLYKKYKVSVNFSCLQFVVKFNRNNTYKYFIDELNYSLKDNKVIFSAAKAGDIKLLELSVEQGSSLNDVITSNDQDLFNDTTLLAGATLLHLAVSGGHVQMVQYLLEKGLKLDARDEDGHLPYQYIYNRYNGAFPSITYQPIIEFFANNSQSLNLPGNFKQELLRLCITNNDFENAKLLIEKHNLNISELNDQGHSLMHLTLSKVEWKNFEFAKYLYNKANNHKVKENFHNDINNLGRKNLQAAQVLLCYLNISNTPLSFARDALFFAAKRNWQGLIDYCLDQGIDINTVDDNGNNLLHCIFSTTSSKLMNLVVYLIEKGININHLNNFYRSPLQILIEQGINIQDDKEIAGILIDYGCNVTDIVSQILKVPYVLHPYHNAFLRSVKYTDDLYNKCLTPILPLSNQQVNVIILPTTFSITKRFKAAEAKIAFTDPQPLPAPQPHAQALPLAGQPQPVVAANQALAQAQPIPQPFVAQAQLHAPALPWLQLQPHVQALPLAGQPQPFVAQAHLPGPGLQLAGQPQPLAAQSVQQKVIIEARLKSLCLKSGVPVNFTNYIKSLNLPVDVRDKIINSVNSFLTKPKTLKEIFDTFLPAIAYEAYGDLIPGPIALDTARNFYVKSNNLDKLKSKNSEYSKVVKFYDDNPFLRSDSFLVALNIPDMTKKLLHCFYRAPQAAEMFFKEMEKLILSSKDFILIKKFKYACKNPVNHLEFKINGGEKTDEELAADRERQEMQKLKNSCYSMDRWVKRVDLKRKGESLDRSEPAKYQADEVANQGPGM